MRRTRIVGAFAVVVALVLAMTPAIAGDRIGNPDYKGKGRVDRSMKVEFRIYEKGRRHLVNFLARNVRFLCSDNTEKERRDLAIVRTPMDKDGHRFERVIYDNSNGEGIYWFRGELSDGGRRARGFVLVMANPPQAEEESGVPECTTFGKRHWVAKRIERPGR